MLTRLLPVLLLLLLVSPAFAASGDIPEAIQGRWVDRGERCDASGQPMTISATTLVYADGRIDDALFEPDGEGGDGVIRLRDESPTSYEYDAASDTLLFRPEGFGMGSVFTMLRCGERTSILERRCGWLANLSNGNWSLVDADDTWILSERSVPAADTMAVMDMVPAFDPEQFVSTGTYTGYGCACMTVTTDGPQHRITAITSSSRQPLATCQSDPSLPAVID